MDSGFRLRGVVLALVAVVAVGGCRGFATSRAEMTPPPQVASSARVTESGVAKIVIDRDCSRLGDAADEYVCLTNADTAPADMGAWILRNVLGHLHWAYRVNPAWESGDKLTLHNQEDVEVFVSDPTKR